MANPDGTPREAQVILYHGAGSITYRENDSGKIVDWEWDWPENQPRKFKVVIENGDATATVNLLNASCAQWSSGTGALSLGDKVRFGLYQFGTDTVDVLFKGVVTDISPTADGAIVVTAEDHMRRLDMVKRDMVHGATYRDGLCFVCTDAAALGYHAINSVSDGGIVTPFARLGYASSDIPTNYGDGTPDTQHAMNDPADWTAQAFYAQGDLATITFRYDTDAGFTSDLAIVIVTDNEDSPVGGTEIYSGTETILGSQTNKSVTHWPWDTAPTPDQPLPLVVGQKYWLLFRPTADEGADGLELGTEGANINTALITRYVYDCAGSGATNELDKVLHVDLQFLNFVVLDPKDYLFVDASDKVFVNPSDYNYLVGTSVRAKLSYFYGTFTLEDLVKRLIRCNTGLLGSVSANLDRTLRTYGTRGRTIGDCLRELMDLYETGGTWSGKQHVMAHYEDGSSIQRLKVGVRLNTSDSTSFIFSHGDDTANDDELVIIEGVDLRKTNRMKYSQVIVTGEDASGTPLVATRSDKAKSGSFWAAMSGITETLRVHGDWITSLQEANDEAYRMLDAVSRDVWEGEMRLSGHHMLMDWDTTSDSYGSGKIITLNWSPLGISATKFKVTRMIIKTHETVIYVNNVDPLLYNRITQTMGSAARSEAFLAPMDTPDYVYGETYDASVIDDATLYMALCDSGGTQTGPRVKCTKFASTTYNMNTYNARFPPAAGYTKGLQGIRYLKLYDAITGGTLKGTVDLYRTTSSIEIDERIDHFQGSVIIVDYNCKNS